MILLQHLLRSHLREISQLDKITAAEKKKGNKMIRTQEMNKNHHHHHNQTHAKNIKIM